MGLTVQLPEMNIKEEEIRILLAKSLFEGGTVSLGKAAEVAGYSVKAFVEILIHRGVAPIKFSDINLDEELANA